MLLTLFLTFAKIGLFTFGGGYAMISMIEHVCVEQKKWITHDDLVNVTVIAESTSAISRKDSPGQSPRRSAWSCRPL